MGIEEVATLRALDALLAASAERPVLLFKHSSICHVSADALARFERFAADPGPAGARPAIVLVIEHRPVSNEVAARLGVRHESPQAILVSRGRAVWHASHGQVDERRLREAVAALPAVDAESLQIH